MAETSRAHGSELQKLIAWEEADGLIETQSGVAVVARGVTEAATSCSNDSALRATAPTEGEQTTCENKLQSRDELQNSDNAHRGHPIETWGDIDVRRRQRFTRGDPHEAARAVTREERTETEVRSPTEQCLQQEHLRVLVALQRNGLDEAVARDRSRGKQLNMLQKLQS